MNRCLVWVFSNHPVFVLVSFVVFHNFPLLEYHVLLVKHNLLRGTFPVQADLPSSRLADTAFFATAPAHFVAVSHSGNFHSVCGFFIIIFELPRSHDKT